MKKLMIALAMGTLLMPFITHATPLTLALTSASGGQVANQGGMTIRYYPNHEMSASVYNKAAIKNMLILSQRLGWNTVYIPDLPQALRGYAKQYFSDNNIDLNVLSDDAYKIEELEETQMDDQIELNREESYYIPDGAAGFFYGYPGNGNGSSYYNHWGYRGYNDYHSGHHGGYPGHAPHNAGHHERGHR